MAVKNSVRLFLRCAVGLIVLAAFVFVSFLYPVLTAVCAIVLFSILILMTIFAVLGGRRGDL